MNQKENKLPEIEILKIAQFSKLALYFPVYLADFLGFFRKENLKLEYFSSGSDVATFKKILDKSADIGISDGICAMSQNKFYKKGMILGQLCEGMPLSLVSKKNLKKKANLKKILTFPEYTTTNILTKKYFPDLELFPINFKNIAEKFLNSDFEKAVMLKEQAFDLAEKNLDITVKNLEENHKNFLFTGFIILENPKSDLEKKMMKFLQAVEKSLIYMGENEDICGNIFKKIFPEKNKKIFNIYKLHWSKSVEVTQKNYDTSLSFWRNETSYFLQKYKSLYFQKDLSEKIFEILVLGTFRREMPYKKYELRKIISDFIRANKPIKILAYWGASDKNKISSSDLKTLDFLKKLILNISEIYVPSIEITFLLSDVHAELNGYKKENYRSYLKQISQKLEKNKNMKFIYLSDFLDKNSKNKINLEKFNFESSQIKNKLLFQAEKHGRTGSKEFHAEKYFYQRVLESKLIEEKFKDFIFSAYSVGDMQEIYPQIPTLYFWVTKKKDGVVPWFREN